MCPRSKDITHISILFCAFHTVFQSLAYLLCCLWFPFHCWLFFIIFFTLFTFVCWCSVSYCTGRYACTVHHCSLRECLWSKVGQKAPWFILPTNPLSLRWASRGEGWCRQVQLFCFSTHTHRASVHNLLNMNSYDEVCTKVIIFSDSFSFIILSSLCQSLQLFVQTNMNILFNCDVTNEVVFYFCRNTPGWLHADTPNLPGPRQVPAGLASAVSFLLTRNISVNLFSSENLQWVTITLS